MADAETNTDLDSLIQGGEAALGAVFARHQRPLERMIEFRLDERVRGRIDPEDVLQEAFIEASRRLTEFLAAPNVSFYVWLRQITYQTLLTVQRRHFGQKRDPRLEVNGHVVSSYSFLNSGSTSRNPSAASNGQQGPSPSSSPAYPSSEAPR